MAITHLILPLLFVAYYTGVFSPSLSLLPLPLTLFHISPSLKIIYASVFLLLVFLEFTRTILAYQSSILLYSSTKQGL